MYLTRREVMVAPGRAAEFEAWWAEGQEGLKGQKGFSLSTLHNSLGYPNKYTALTRFETREDSQASQNSAAFRARLQARPEGLIVGRPRPTEAYEPVHRVGPTGGPAAFTTLVEWNVTPGTARAFESSRQELFDLRQKHLKGFVRASLWRFLGNRTQYLVINGNAGGQGNGPQEPEIAAFQRAHPSSEYASAPPVIENYRNVQRVRA